MSLAHLEVLSPTENHAIYWFTNHIITTTLQSHTP